MINQYQLVSTTTYEDTSSIKSDNSDLSSNLKNDTSTSSYTQINTESTKNISSDSSSEVSNDQGSTTSVAKSTSNTNSNLDVFSNTSLTNTNNTLNSKSDGNKSLSDNYTNISTVSSLTKDTNNSITNTSVDNIEIKNNSNNTITSENIQNTTLNNVINNVITNTTEIYTNESSTIKTVNNTLLKTASKTLTTKITINSATLYSYELYTITATVADSNNNYVDSGIVAFKINGITIGHATVSNGKAIINYTVPALLAKDYTITAIYGGSTSLASSQTTATLTIKQYNTIGYVTSITTKNNATAVFRAVIKTTTGAFVKSGTVAFKVNGVTIGKSTVDNGVATLNYVIPASWSKESYTITVVYGETKIYGSTTATGTLKLTIATAGQTSKTSTKMSINSETLHPYEKYVMTATVVDKNGNYVNSGIVAFKVNGITIGHASVSNGKATIVYTVPALLAKDYTVTVIYGGTDNLASCKSTGILTVQQYDTTAYVSPLSSKASGNVTLRTVLKTTTGAFVKSGTVAFKINGITVGTASVVNGVATLKYTIPLTLDSGNYVISVVYGETKVYNSCSGKGTLKISATSGSSSVPSGYEKYLVATTNCQVNSATIQNIASLFNGYTNTLTKAQKIFTYLNDKTYYQYYSNTLYGAVGTWNNKYGNCVDLSHLVIAVMRAAGIPARYVHGYCTFNSGLQVGHVWAEVYVNGKWYTCDASSSQNTFGVINNWYSASIYGRYITLPF